MRGWCKLLAEGGKYVGSREKLLGMLKLVDYCHSFRGWAEALGNGLGPRESA